MLLLQSHSKSSSTANCSRLCLLLCLYGVMIITVYCDDPYTPDDTQKNGHGSRFENDSKISVEASSDQSFTLPPVSGSKKMTDEDRLFEELFTRRYYNADSRPVERAHDIVQVEMAIAPIQVVQVDVLNENLRSHVWLDVAWTDFRLGWNANTYGGLELITVPYNKVWTPDIVLMNSAEEWKTFAEVNVVISSDGRCNWFPPIMSASSCPIDIAWFPFDKQNCSITFESWNYDVSMLNLTLKQVGDGPVTMSHFRRNSEWDLIGVHYLDQPIQHPCCLYPTCHLEFIFRLRRRILFYGFNLMMPCTLLSALLAATFILPPESGERIGLGISILLALSVNQLIVADRVPPTSDAIPIIGIYFASVMIMNTVSLMAMVYIANVYHRSSSMHRLPDWVKILICARLGKLLRLPRPNERNLIRVKRLKVNSVGVHGNVDEPGLNKISSVATVKPNHDFTRGYSSASCESIKHYPFEEEDLTEEFNWKYAARVIDRLCTCICMVYIMVVTVAFYATGIIIWSK